VIKVKENMKSFLKKTNERFMLGYCMHLICC